MQRNSMINFANPLSEYLLLKKKIDKQIAKVLNSNNYILGNQVKMFEKNFSKMNSSKYCIGVSNGTDALIIALKCLGIKQNDYILVPSHTAMATISAIVEVGAKPLFVDINDEFNIDEYKIPNKINNKVKAIILVHLYGNPCNVNKFIRIAKKNKIKIIEDCSQAHLAEYKNKKVGNFGDIACFSFYPTKNLSAMGDAGAIITNSKRNYNRCKLLREYGWIKKNYSMMDGSNKRLDEIQAGILNIKLKKINFFTNQRIKIAKFYLKNISNINIILPEINPLKKHVYHLFVVKIKNKLREKFINKLRKNKINPGIHYILPNHKQKPYKIYSHNELTITNKISSQILSIPIYPLLNKKNQKKIVTILNSIK